MPSATAPPTALPPSFNAYRILSLPAPFTAGASSPSSASVTQPHTPAAIKAAYRRALLTHHPDKSPAATPAQQKTAAASQNDGAQTTTTSSSYTVDDITTAYKTLLDPAARAAHDRALRLRGNSRSGDADAEEEWRLGLEAVDLDDLAFDEAAGGTWWRGCRCGEERGFVVDEEALERAGEVGEVLVGCVGCSLWIRVGFAVADEDGE
ncbi:Diphthamide biosynthesis protein 4 [Neofusicoccum ribis]|uniref:Diphthamide biosynthesis protein 4 n=1 Tax=Neofusicoccum ribis TaxID=45134 RepID=A0ABR3T6J7_9PEZI